MKQNKRMLERAARKIDRERTKVEAQEAKHLKEITKLAKAGQHVISFSSKSFSKQPRFYRKTLSESDSKSLSTTVWEVS